MYIKSTYDGLHVITGTTEGVRASHSKLQPDPDTSEMDFPSRHGSVVYRKAIIAQWLQLGGACISARRCETCSLCSTEINKLRSGRSHRFSSSDPVVSSRPL